MSMRSPPSLPSIRPPLLPTLSSHPPAVVQTLPVPVYLTLLPVVVGVALTCCGQGIRFRCVVCG